MIVLSKLKNHIFQLKEHFCLIIFSLSIYVSNSQPCCHQIFVSSSHENISTTHHSNKKKVHISKFCLMHEAMIGFVVFSTLLYFDDG